MSSGLPTTPARLVLAGAFAVIQSPGLLPAGHSPQWILLILGGSAPATSFFLLETSPGDSSPPVLVLPS